MKSLIKLWIYKQKGTIRNLFRKPSSAIFTIILILFYGWIIFNSLFNDNKMSGALTASINLETGVLISLAMTAALSMIVLMAKRTALVYEEDAFYLFAGPYTQSVTQKFISLQTFLQSFFYSLLSLVMMILMMNGISYSPLYLLLVFLVNYAIYMIFFLLSSYLYVLRISENKYQNLSRMIGYFFIGIVFALALYVLIINDFKVNSSLVDFAQSKLFYYIPVFGWAKLALVSFVEGNYINVVIGFGLLIMLAVVFFYLFVNFKGDYKEQAVEDSAYYSSIRKNAKMGKIDANRDVKKIKIVNGEFKSGAWAIVSKQLLEMRKRNALVSKQELFVLVFFLIIGYFIDGGMFSMIIMLIYWLIINIQNSDIKSEFDTYYIYLIPDHPFKKLIAVIAPSFIKMSIVSGIYVIISGLLMSPNLIEIIEYIVLIVGYVCVAISALVLSIRILRSRSNRIFVSAMQMLIGMVCVIPSIVLTLILMFSFQLSADSLLKVVSILSLVLNIGISLLILVACKNMLRGNEINSD